MKRFYLHRPDEHRHFSKRPMGKGFECVVKLLRAEIEYDIKYSLWKRAQMLNIQGENARNYEITEDDEDWMIRQIETAAYIIRNKLSWALREDNKSRLSSDEILENPKEWNFVFIFDKGWIGSVNSIMNALHNYVVNFVLSEWCKIGLPDVWALYSSTSDDYLNMAYNEMDNYIIDKPVFRL